MFVLCLLVGPLLGLLAMYGLDRSGFDRRLGAVIVGLILVFLLLTGLLHLEVRIALVSGILLGLLLGSTPDFLPYADESA